MRWGLDFGWNIDGIVEVVLRSRMEEVYERNPSSPRRRRSYEARARPAKIALELHVEAFDFVLGF